jgi:NDP-sugar pyrophosphorylase family protein
MEAITKNGRQMVTVTDAAGRLVGLVTDGDVRRGILRGASLDGPVTKVLNPHPIGAAAELTRDEAVALMQRRGLRYLPLLDAERRLVDVVFLDDLLSPAPLPNAAVIMAGGFGRRLAPLTEETPKPLLKVGGKPIIEIMIERLRAAGIHDVFMTLHYKKQMIEDHIGNGDRLGVRIRYHYEEAPRGTAGSLCDLQRDYPQALAQPFLLVNGDILTKCDFGAMLRFHGEHDAVMTVGTVPYTVDLPYGVLEIEGATLAGVTEKPRLDFQINSGIYVITPLAVELAIPPGGVVDIPQVIEELTRLKRRVVAFPIREYWLDVGRHDDLSKADRDVAEGLLE